MPTAKRNTANYTPKVYAYGMINDDMAARIADELQAYEGSGCERIQLRMNTPGGSIGAGTGIYNTIKACAVPVDIYIDGMAASMGAYIAMAGDKVYMSKFARMMLHEGRSGEGGTADELREMATEVDANNANLLAMTCAKTGRPEAEIKAKFFNGKDNFIGAVEAKALGLVDDIYDLNEVKGLATATDFTVYAIMDAAYQTGLFNHQNEDNMEAIQVSKEVVACLGLKRNYDMAAIEAGVLALNKKYTDLLDQMEEQETANMKQQITTLLEGAKNNITAQQRRLFEAKYATDPEGLKAMLKTMGFTSVTTIINNASPERGGEASAEYTPEVKALMAKGYKALWKSGELGRLKAKDENAYLALYQEEHKCLPNEREYQEKLPKKK